jgi:probable F420-dependent oxidoreductase
LRYPARVPPRIGVSTLVADPSGWPAWCRRLEDAGVDEISAADHLKPGVLPPMVALAAAATATERVTLSTLVLNNELRHPGVLAHEAALLAELSSGRFTLGIGAGHAVDEHAAIGVPLPPVEERIARLEETVAAVRALLDGQVVSTEGPHLHWARLQVTRVPRRPVPLLVGGGAKAVLRIAARHADVAGLTGFSSVGGATRLTHLTDGGLAERVAWLRDQPRQRPEPLRLQALVQLLQVTDDRQAAAEVVAAEWADDGLTVADVLASPFLLLGTAAEIAQQLHERTERFGIETWTVFAGRPIDAPLDYLAAVAAALHA